MADEVKGTGAPNAPVGDAAPTKEQQPTKYAGKFEGGDALIEGIVNIRKMGGQPDIPAERLKAFYGDDLKTAEAEYLSLQSALGKRAKETGKTGTLLDQILSPEKESEKADVDPLPAAQVLQRAGLEIDKVYSEYVKGERKLTDDTYEKLRVHDPVASQMPKKAGMEYVRYNVDKHFGAVADAGVKAIAIAGSEDALKVLIADRNKYVPADERAEIDEALNGTPNVFLAAVRSLKRYRDTNAPAAPKGTVSGDRSPPSGTKYTPDQLQAARRRLIANPGDADAARVVMEGHAL